MNIVIEYTVSTRVKPYIISDTPMFPVKAFMDDLNLLTSSVSDSQPDYSRHAR